METEIGRDEAVSTAVIRAVSAVNGREPDALQPLTAIIDPEALDALFAPRPNGTVRGGGRLSFSYDRCRITIDNGEYLTIEPFETTGRVPPTPDGTARTKRSHSDRDNPQTATKRTTGSRVCFVCQQPIEEGNLQRERGELVHSKCQSDLRCGISLEKWSGYSV
jgi:hypothetical protein